MPENTNKVIQLQDNEGNDVSPVVNVGSIYDKNGQKIDNLLSYVVAGTDVPIPEVGDITDDLQDQVDQMVSTATSQVNEMVSTATSQIDAKLDAVDEALDGIDTAVDDKLSSGGLPINDVRTYPVREGEVIHAGDVVNVGKQLLSGSEQTYGDLPVGSTIQINENGSPVDYLVVHQGNPDPELYDLSCDGTWLLRSTKFGSSTWGPSSNRFPNTTIFNKLQTDFLSVFSEDTLSKIKTVKIPYGNSDYNTLVSSGADGVECKAFLLCPYELGFVGSFLKDGVKLDYFIADNASSEACDLRKGIGATRTENSGWFYVDSSGHCDDVSSQSGLNFTPCIIFDSSTHTDGAPVYAQKTVYRDVTPQDNVENVITEYSISGQAVFLLTENTPVVISQYYELLGIRTYVKFLSSDGSAVIAEDSFTGSSNVSVGKISDTRFIVQTSQNNTALQGIILTYEDGLISKGNVKTILDTGGKTNNSCVVVISENTAFSIYNSNGIKMKMLSFSSSSNNITVSSSATSLSGSTGANYISACRLPDDASGNKRVCICFSDTGDGNKGKAVIATISSNNTVTFGNIVTVYDSTVVQINACVANEKLIITMARYVYTAELDLSNITQLSGRFSDDGTEVTYNDVPLIPIGENVVALFGGSVIDGTNGGVAYFIDTNAGTVTQAYTFNTKSANYLSATLVSDDTILAAYSDGNNSSYGTTTILEVSGNQIAGSFLDGSQDAIALADGTGGQSIPAGFGGYCKCPGVTKDQTINSSGVDAFSPVNDWLYVTPLQLKSCVIGEYIGTQSTIGGKFLSKEIDVGFPCSAIFITNNRSAFNSALMKADTILIRGMTCGMVHNNTGYGYTLEWTDRGVIITTSSAGIDANCCFDKNGEKYIYIAWR